MRFKKIVESKEKEIKSQKDILDDTINVENKSAEDKVKEDRKKNADNFKKVINELPIVEGYSYTENNGNYTVNIPNRASLAVLVEKLKNEAIKHRITRSTVEGYRYNVTFKYEKKDLKEANLRNNQLNKGDKVRLDKQWNTNIKDKSLLDDEYEVIGFWNNEKVVDDDKAPEDVRDLSGVRIKNTRTGKQYSVNRYQLTSLDESVLTEDPIQDRLEEIRQISRQRQLTDDEVRELAELSKKKNENLTEGKVNANIYTILGWLANHKQAYNDFKSYFKLFDKGNSKMPTLDDIKGWISDHKELTQDYENFFDDKLTESCDTKKLKESISRGEFTDLVFDTLLHHPSNPYLDPDKIGDSIDYPNEVDNEQGEIRLNYDGKYYLLKVQEINDINESCGKKKLTEGEFGDDLVLSKIETNHLLKDGAVDIARYVGQIEIHIEERPYEEGKYDIYIMNPFDEVKLTESRLVKRYGKNALREKAPRELSNKEIDRKVGQRQRYLNHINKEKKVSEPLFTYQFPELTNTDIRKLKDYNLKLEARFVDSDDFSTEGDCVVSGTENNIKKYADEYLGYELIDDYLVNYNDFDFEDLVAQGKLALEEKKVDNKKQPKVRIVGDGEEEMKFFNDTASGDLGKAMCEDKDDDSDDDFGDLEEPIVDDDTEITLDDISDDDDLSALEILKDKIDVHGELSDDGESEIITIAEKGKLDDKKAPKVTIEANEEETEVLAKEFCDDDDCQKVEIEGDDEYDFSDIKNVEYVDSAKEQEKKEAELEEKINSQAQQVVTKGAPKQEDILEKIKKANNLDDEVVTIEEDVDSIKGLESLM